MFNLKSRIDCPACKGTGSMEYVEDVGVPGAEHAYIDECWRCNGAGTLAIADQSPVQLIRLAEEDHLESLPAMYLEALVTAAQTSLQDVPASDLRQPYMRLVFGTPVRYALDAEQWARQPQEIPF